MKLSEIKKKAQNLGINTGTSSNKKKIIHQIQMNENNKPCFDTGIIDCNQISCMWWDDCMK